MADPVSERCAAEMRGLLRFAQGLGRTRKHSLLTPVLRQLWLLSSMKILAAYFRTQADLCREIADALAHQDDPVISKLRDMADEFDHNASALERWLAEEASSEPVRAGTPCLH
ncbi:hypothetical protein [Methylorubrum sp. GM97]|uniref:hypothetical protein n=1 Tax=Methylorubrum sp. GM97 TaxID=2938232 RepID=UPI0021C2DFD6|nr:hypothetical protein [Methylorubrum sp. GM97]